MNTIKSIQIQSPCHESWNGMTPNAAGRHCQSCNKTVTDFSQMTDAEIINYLSTTKNVCGRIGTSQLKQLNAKLTIERLSLKPVWQRLLVAAGLFLSSSYLKAAPAAKTLMVQAHSINEATDTNKTKIMGKIAVPAPSYKTIKGVIVDERDSVMAGATIKTANCYLGTITNLKGEFTLTVPANEKELIVASIGYETRIVKIKRLKGNIIRLKLNEMALGGLGVVKMSVYEIACQRLVISPLKRIFG